MIINCKAEQYNHLIQLRISNDGIECYNLGVFDMDCLHHELTMKLTIDFDMDQLN